MRDNKRIIDFSRDLAYPVLKVVNSLLWANRCVNCGALADEDGGELCDECWGELNRQIAGEYCPGCGRDVSRFAVFRGKCPQCLREDNYFDGIIRVGVYGAVLQNSILAFKNGKTNLAGFLGMLAASAFQAAELKNKIDAFVPVPLHWTRRLKRGYNQTLLLASKISEPDKIISDELVRIRRTKMQSEYISFAKRRKNVEGAFALRSDHSLAGKTVCLVDDIKTTGATLNECSRVLKQAGVAKVYGLVLAVAGQNSG